MSNRAPITSEDTSGAPAPLEVGSLVAGTTPGYWRLVASAMSGVSAFGASLIAAASAAAARAILGAVSLSGDTMTGPLLINNPSGTALQVTDAAGTGELAVKVRTSAATSTAAQAGMDFGFSNSYRVTFATAGTGVASPWGGTAYFYVTGPTNGMRFIEADSLKPIEFWVHNGSAVALAARAYRGALQVGQTAMTATSTYGVPLYCGSSTAKQLRVGQTDGYCWTMGRHNTSGNFQLSATDNAGTDLFANALEVLWASGVCKSTFGQVVGASGTTITQIKVYTPTLTPADVAAADEYNEQKFTVTGLSTSDTIVVNPPAMSDVPHSQLIAFRVSAADTLALTFRSVSGTHTPPQGVYRIVSYRS